MTTGKKIVAPHLPFPEYVLEEGLNATMLTDLSSTSPLHAIYKKRNPPESVALRRGRATHTYILEGVEVFEENYFELPSDIDGRTKEGKSLYEQARNEGKCLLNKGTTAAIRAMAESISRCPLTKDIFADGKPEVSIFWEHPEFGVESKARLDWVPRDGEVFTDLKTTRSVNPHYLRKAIHDYRYEIRSAWQANGIKEVGLCDRPMIQLLFVEESPPHDIALVRHDSLALRWAEEEISRLVDVYRRCLETDHWPGYCEAFHDSLGVQWIGLPQWVEDEYLSNEPDDTCPTILDAG